MAFRIAGLLVAAGWGVVAGLWMPRAGPAPGRTRDLERWYATLRAPDKEIVTIPDAGHRSLYQQPEAFGQIMDRVLAETR